MRAPGGSVSFSPPTSGEVAVSLAALVTSLTTFSEEGQSSG